MEYLGVIFVHVLSGILWAGAAVVIGLFIMPSLLDAGPAGSAVMAGVVKRRMPVFLTIVGLLSVLTGIRLYMIRFTSSWFTSPEGLVLTLGGLLGIAAMVIGVFIQKPLGEQLGALGVKIASSGAPPSAADLAEMQRLRERMRRVARLTAWHLLGAASLMAMHRFVGAL